MSETSRRALAVVAAMLALGAAPAAAELPALLRTENSRVREGNEKLNKGDAKGALESYTLAARELPDAPGVQLDRGLALLKSGDLAKARESFLTATAPSAPTALRADAYQNLALAFYREGDQLAAQNKHREAQQRFRESVDAGKRSLRLRPGDAAVAWNLELAQRRIREEEQKQKEEDEKKKQEEDQNQDKQPDDSKDDSQNEDQQSDQNQDQQQDESGKQDPQQQDDAPQQQDPKQEPEQQQQKPAEQDPQKPPEESQSGQESGKQEPDAAEGSQLPVEAEQALDALSDSEENFERYRARQRASRERRPPEKDW